MARTRQCDNAAVNIVPRARLQHSVRSAPKLLQLRINPGVCPWQTANSALGINREALQATEKGKIDFLPSSCSLNLGICFLLCLAFKTGVLAPLL